jgi:hypothetical protein
VPRTNVSPSLSAAACTGDVRTVYYFFVQVANGYIVSLPATNTYNKVTAYIGPYQGTGQSNLILQTFNESFYLNGSGLAPAGE